MKIIVKQKLFFALVLITALTNCAELKDANLGGMKLGQLGSQIASSAGVSASSTEIDSFLDSGAKLVKAARGLTEEQEYYLGRGVSAIILGKYSLASSSRYLTTIARVVASYSERPETFGGYHVGVINSAEINAISAPGGFIFITSGFLKKIKNEDELAAVLAHEVAHIVKGHGVAAISQSNITSALTTIGKQVASREGGAYTQELVGTFGESITEVTESLLEKGYSRSQEYEADNYAAELLLKAEYNQPSIVTMLETLKTAASTNTKQGSWFTTHPSPEKRIDELEDEFDFSKVPPSKGLEMRARRFRGNI